MKTLSLNILILFVTTSLVAQMPKSINKKTETALKTVISDGKIFTVKQNETTEFLPNLDNSPKGYLRTTIKTEFENDRASIYNNLVALEYKDTQKVNLDFTVTKNGVIVGSSTKEIFVKNIKNEKGETCNSITKEEQYLVNLSNGEQLTLNVTDFEIM